jgi:hypothetical protein
VRVCACAGEGVTLKVKLALSLCTHTGRNGTCLFFSVLKAEEVKSTKYRGRKRASHGLSLSGNTNFFSACKNKRGTRDMGHGTRECQLHPMNGIHASEGAPTKEHSEKSTFKSVKSLETIPIYM